MIGFCLPKKKKKKIFFCYCEGLNKKMKRYKDLKRKPIEAILESRETEVKVRQYNLASSPGPLCDHVHASID